MRFLSCVIVWGLVLSGLGGWGEACAEPVATMGRQSGKNPARIEKTVGPVQLMSDGQVRSVTMAAAIRAGDTVLVGAGGRARLVLAEGVTVLLGEQAALKIEGMSREEAFAGNAGNVAEQMTRGDRSSFDSGTVEVVLIAGAAQFVSPLYVQASAPAVRIHLREAKVLQRWGEVWIGPRDGVPHVLLLSGEARVDGKASVTLNRIADGVSLVDETPEYRRWSLSDLRRALASVVMPEWHGALREYP